MKYKNIIKEPKFNGVYSKDNLYKIKDEVYVVNLADYESVGTNWIELYVNGEKVVYFDSFWIECISKEIKKFIGNQKTIKNIYSKQAYDSIVCRYFSIGFISFMLKGKSLLGCTNLFSPKKYEKNDKILSKYFHLIYYIIVINIKNSNILKYNVFLKKYLVFLLFAVSVVMNIKIFEEEELIKIFKKSFFNYQYWRVSENI